MPRRHHYTVDDFEFVNLLGEGSYGSVYKALNSVDGTSVAIKVIPVENDSTDLQREIDILQKCNNPSIVNYIDSFRDESSKDFQIVMEYCGAGSVIDLMTICRITLTEEQIAVVCRESLLGLKYLHSQKFIHRDIKAGNILLNSDGRAKLADFGVSAQLTNTISKRKTVIGTPFQMAPEVLLESEYNQKADIWSLGITAIEMAAGAPPHSNIHPMRAIFMIPNKPPPKLPVPEQYSNSFNDFIRLCLNKDAESRPSADELLMHPFIRTAKSCLVLQDLVHECMPEIQAYRDKQLEDDDENGEDGSNQSPREQEAGQQHQANVGHNLPVTEGTMRIIDDDSARSSITGTALFNSGINSNNSSTICYNTIIDNSRNNDDDAPNNNQGDTMITKPTNNNTDTIGTYSDSTMIFRFDDKTDTQKQKSDTAASPNYATETIRRTEQTDDIMPFMNYFKTLNFNSNNSKNSLSTSASKPVIPNKFTSLMVPTPQSTLQNGIDTIPLENLKELNLSLEQTYKREREMIDTLYASHSRELQKQIEKIEQKNKNKVSTKSKNKNNSKNKSKSSIDHNPNSTQNSNKSTARKSIRKFFSRS